MTIPAERTRAVLNTEEFLVSLTDPKRTPRVPSLVRRQALLLLRHYPNRWDMTAAAEAAPRLFGPPAEATRTAAPPPAAARARPQRAAASTGRQP